MTLLHDYVFLMRLAMLNVLSCVDTKIWKQIEADTCTNKIRFYLKFNMGYNSLGILWFYLQSGIWLKGDWRLILERMNLTWLGNLVKNSLLESLVVLRGDLKTSEIYSGSNVFSPAEGTWIDVQGVYWWGHTISGIH